MFPVDLLWLIPFVSSYYFGSMGSIIPRLLYTDVYKYGCFVFFKYLDYLHVTSLYLRHWPWVVVFWDMLFCTMSCFFVSSYCINIINHMLILCLFVRKNNNRLVFEDKNNLFLPDISGCPF